MIKYILKKILNFFFKSNRKKDSLLNFIFKVVDRDPLLFAYNKNGILNYENNNISGESFLISEILPKYISKHEKSVIFDVGANIGNYSSSLAEIYTSCFIYAFEPNFKTFNQLKKNTENLKRIIPINIGLSDKKKEKKIYTYLNELDSEHASLYKEVFSDLHKNNKITSLKINLDCLDEFCKNHKIDTIDFLKIDTEGHEMDVLKGGLQMINGGNIKIIQFEFNEMNIVSRVFLKDFYQILKAYKIYRLCETELIPLFHYDSINEIFKFQNIIAIHDKL
jgi:FkbM family methyltransferase